MSNESGRLIWFECATTDAARAKSFYAEVFGWQMEDAPMPGEGGGVYTLIKVEGEDIAGLYEMAGPMFEGVPPHWMTYVRVENAADSTARAQALGANVLTGPMDVPGVGKMSFVKDPAGAAIALFEPGEHVGASSKSNLGWSELHTTDAEGAVAFYTQLFGWGVRRDDEHGYTEWLVGDEPIGGMMEIEPECRSQVPPHWLPYVLVDDCDATLQRATDRDATVIVPATTMDGVGRFAVMTDPLGASLAMIRLEHHD